MTRLSHWMARTRFYRIYSHIRNRCNRKENCNYKNYWWKWIKNEWNNFEEFKKDMYENYLCLSNQIWENNVSIDRINNSKNYCKENCRWVNLKEQQENRDINHYINYNWEIHNLRKWSRILWIDENVLRRRIVVLKWEIEKAFNTPILNKTIHKLNWHKWTLTELSKILWISRSSVYRKIKENQ
mgnify:FL=1